MLVKFTFKNFRSFFDEQHLSMEASHDDSMQDSVNTKCQALVPQSAGILKSAAVFGSTASGKTNVLKALDYMKRVVQISGSRVQIARQNEPFAFLEGAENMDSHYEAEFIENGTYYRYGFVIRSGEIVKEWLFRRAERLTPVFSRDEYSLKISGLSKNAARLLSPSSSTLFLTVASSLNMEINREIQDVLSWFSNLIVSFSPRQDDLIIYTEKDEYLKEALAVLSLAGCGIDSLSLIQDGSYIDIETGHKIFNSAGAVSKIRKSRLFQDRQLYSDGTVGLICDLALILHALDTGAVLCINDFSSMMNIFLASHLISLFSSESRNERSAQLILTGGISPLTDKAFRRDQIYLTTKDEQHRSHLVRLSGIPGVRKSDNYEKKLLESALSSAGGIIA